MPNADDLIVSISGRIVHEWDFAFYKNNGETANRVRDQIGSAAKAISIDDEGDIDIQSDQGSFFLTPAGIIAGGWLTHLNNLSVPGGADEFAQIIESLARAKGSFKPNGYSVRLFLRFTPANGLTLIGSRGFESILSSVLAEKSPSTVKTYKFSSRYDKGDYLDTLELEVSEKDVQLRYSRDKNGTSFDSYRAFLAAADLVGLIEELRPFAKILAGAEPQLRRRALFPMGTDPSKMSK
jgi:hypothetical protein